LAQARAATQLRDLPAEFRTLRVVSSAAMDLTIDGFNTLCTKAEGRDKVARFFQYGARAIVGFSSMAAPKAGSTLNTVETHARTAMTQLAGARRTHRWCKEFPVIQSIPKCLTIVDPIDRVLDLFQKTSLATFMMIDHVGHMKQWKILRGGKRSGAGTIQLGLKFFCFSNFIGFLVQAKKLLALSLSEDNKSKEKKKCMETAFKHLLIVLQTAHLSRMRETHDALVGMAGMISSSMDVLTQWPAKKVTNPEPDAKAKAK